MDHGDEDDGEEPEEEGRDRVPHHGPDEPIRRAAGRGGAHAGTASAAASDDSTSGVHGSRRTRSRPYHAVTPPGVLIHLPSRQAHHGSHRGTERVHVAAGQRDEEVPIDPTTTPRRAPAFYTPRATRGETGRKTTRHLPYRAGGVVQWRREEEERWGRARATGPGWGRRS